MNVTLAGLFTNLQQKLDSKKFDLKDLCYSLQETCFALTMEVCERAMAYTNKKEMLIVGGVASNKRLTQMAKEMCTIRGAKYDNFPMEFAMDNGAMIAWQGFVDKKRATTDISKFPVVQYINIESNI
jgi:tRNA A37 threonylcarbamoyltransferase TsaD